MGGIVPRLAIFISVLLFFAPHGQADERLSLHGNYIQGGAIIGQAPPGTRMRLGDLPVMVSQDGLLIFGFDRDHGPSAVLQITYPDGTSEQRLLAIASRDYDIQRIDGLPPSKVTPRTPEEIAHIQRDQAIKRESRKIASRKTWFTETFIWPMTGIITGNFGAQRILNGQPRAPHYGVDIAAPVGADVLAPAGGKVKLAALDMYFEGGLIFLDHGHGFISAFLHLSRIDVAVDDIVKQGQIIAGVGATGRVTGPHLDWRISWLGQQIDPALLAGLMPQPVQAASPMEKLD